MAIRCALVCSILFVNIISHASPQQVFNICCSENESQLWSSQHNNCQSLDSVLSEQLPNNSVLELTNGSCNLTHSLNFTQVSNITIRGQGSQYTHISCHHMNAGLIFNESSNIELRHFTIDSCGLQINHEKLTNLTGNTSKSIVFTNTTNVVLQGLVVANSNGYGLMISDCFGSVILNNITFENNKVIESELEYTYGGGGLVIVFIPYQKQQVTQYTISNCTFENNSANIRKIHRVNEKGGGMSLIFLHYSQDIYIKLDDCYFKNNTGSHGGGLFSWYSDNSTNCHLAVYNTEFYDNHATRLSPSDDEEKTGGGIQLGYSNNPLQIPMNNSMLFDSVNFTANTAYNGGGASLFVSSVSTMQFNQINNITFRDCAFVNNSGNGGSALEITPSYMEQQRCQFIGQVMLIDCVFTDNVPSTSKPFKEREQEATLLTSWIPVNFIGAVKFCNNGASAIYASMALLIFKENTSVEFSNNVGSEGGAIFLAGESRMLVSDNTAFQFTNNTASYGGAICSLPSEDIITYGSCFLMPLERVNKNISLHFAGNKASKQIGNDIFVSSLASCCKFCQSKTENIFSSQCIGNYTFVKTGAPAGSSIATSPLILNTSSSYLELTPGLPHELNITQTDELGNPDMFLVTADITAVTGLVASTIQNNTITIFGKPGTNGTIVLENNAPVVRRKHLDFFLFQCPPGFSLDSDNACTCSASTAHNYFQMPSCHKNSALITHGFWVGYIGNSSSEDTLFTGACVADFCSYKGIPAVNGYNEIPTSIKTRKELEAIVCSENRKGILCSSCIEGHSTFYHSQALTCYNTTTAHCAYGIPLYIVSELLPVTIIFVIILVFNISLTSGALYSFVFYAQVLDFLYIDAFRTLPSVRASITKIVHMLYSTFNLKLFYREDISFCLISNANAMDVFMFEYATRLYAVMLVIATVLVLRLHSCYCCVKLGRRCGRRNIRGSIVDGLSAFLVLCYFQCSLNTFYILTPVILRGNDHVKNQTIPLFLGDSEYFGSGHLPYAIPALLCLVVVMLPPPCILLLEPVATKLFSLRIWPDSVKWAYNKLRLKFMPFLDSFQACFKDKYRFFAGLYFTYRIVIPLLRCLIASKV